MITTVQCSICNQLNNKPRVVVTDFRLHHTCSIIILWLHSLSGVIIESVDRDEPDFPLTQYIRARPIDALHPTSNNNDKYT